MLLPLSSEFWNYSCVPPFLVYVVLGSRFQFGEKDIITLFCPQDGTSACFPAAGPGSSSSCCFAEYTISLHNREHNLIFSLATQLSFQSIIPKYILKKKVSILPLRLLGAWLSLSKNLQINCTNNTFHKLPSNACDVTTVNG